MNGKSCIYERTIHEVIQRQQPQKQKDQKPQEDKKSFVIMPFDPKLNALYKWEIEPILKNGGKKAMKNLSIYA